MRISKEIVEFASGKDARFQPERAAQRSPGVGEGGRERHGPPPPPRPVVEGKRASPSEHVPDAERARTVQTQLAEG
jgi:hypothetical protein